MKIKPVVYGIVVITVFFGVILGFQAAGVWSTSGKVDSSGKSIQPSAADPSTIKGWMTFERRMHPDFNLWNLMRSKEAMVRADYKYTDKKY